MTEHGDEVLTLRRMVQEVVDALAIAETLGERVLIVGCSTGAALCAWLCLQPWALGSLAGCVLVSPNVRTRPVEAVRIMRKFPLLRELIFFMVKGVTIRDQPVSARHELAWTVTYPSHFLPLIFDVSAILALEDPARCKLPMLVFHNPDDPRADFGEAEAFVSQVPQGRLVRVEESEDKHCIVGDIASPSTLPKFHDDITAWLAQQNLIGKLQLDEVRRCKMGQTACRNPGGAPVLLGSEGSTAALGSHSPKMCATRSW